MLRAVRTKERKKRVCSYGKLGRSRAQKSPFVLRAPRFMSDFPLYYSNQSMLKRNLSDCIVNVE